MELWHEVEATVFIVTHSIAEAVYLGRPGLDHDAGAGTDRQRVPGRRSRRPATRDPIAAQESGAFKEAVGEVARAFRDAEARK